MSPQHKPNRRSLIAIDLLANSEHRRPMDVTYEPAALTGLKAMPKADAKRMMDAIQQVADLHPQRLGFVTEMQNQPGYWRARKGDWRAIFRLTDTAIEVVSVAKRAEAYR